MTRAPRYAVLALAFAGMAGLAPLAAQTASAQSAQRAGVAAAVQGDVQVQGPIRTSSETVSAGMDLVLDDRLATGVDSRAQALLVDETTLTLGPESEVTIDRFVFDPDSGASEISAQFVKGAMRFVSGRIGRIAPQNVNLRTPVGTLGIRGTIAFVADDPVRGGVFFGLLGPSRGNDLKSRSAGIEFENAQGRQQTYKSGFGFFVPAGGPPGPVEVIPQEVLDIVKADFRVRPRAKAPLPVVKYSDASAGRTVAEVISFGAEFAELAKERAIKTELANFVADDVIADLTEDLLVGEIINLQDITVFASLFDFQVFDNGILDGDAVDVSVIANGETTNFGRIDLVGLDNSRTLGVELQPGEFEVRITGLNNEITGGVNVLSEVIDGPQLQTFEIDEKDVAVLKGAAEAIVAEEVVDVGDLTLPPGGSTDLIDPGTGQ